MLSCYVRIFKETMNMSTYAYRKFKDQNVYLLCEENAFMSRDFVNHFNALGFEKYSIEHGYAF